MEKLVVDASVVVKWYFDESYFLEARAVLGGHRLLAPDLLFAEVGNVLWQRVRQHDITGSDADRMLANLSQAPIQFIDIPTLARGALTIACENNVTMYDSLYLALAVAKRAVLLTADAKLFHALEASSLAPSVRLLS